MEEKQYACERCKREIRIRGRCLPCNYLYKHRQYFPGLKESPEYDEQYRMDTVLVSKLIAKGWTKKLLKSQESIDTAKKYKYEKTCVFCESKFQTNNEEFQLCYKCFKFFTQFGNIKNYAQFLEAFGLKDNIESKEKYIQFVDNVKRFTEIRGDWQVEKILKNPREFLDKAQPSEKTMTRRRGSVRRRRTIGYLTTDDLNSDK